MFGDPTTLGSQSGFQKQVKVPAPEAKSTCCFIHRYALQQKKMVKREICLFASKSFQYINS